MKRLILAGALAVVWPAQPVASLAEVIGPVTASKSGPGREATASQADTITTEFQVNGLRVILRRNTATDVVAASLFLLGGTQQLTAETQGIEALLFAAAERGSAKYPGPRLRQEIDRLGTEIGAGFSPDWTSYSMKSIRSTFDASWALYTDRLLHPSLAQADVDLMRTQMRTNISRTDLLPDDLLDRLADSVSYAGHPYALSTQGTDRSLANIGPVHLREYMSRTFVTSRMLLVVVGNIERAKLETLVRSSFGSLPVGTYKWVAPAALQSRKATVIRPANLPTNYIRGYYAGPAATSPDYNALRLAAAMLSGSFFSEIRSKRSLSYAADAPFLERAVASGGVYVTTVDPNATLRIMRDEIAQLQTDLIAPDALDRLVEQFITEYFMKNETNLDQANFLARAAIYQGDYRAADRFVEDLRKVRPNDIRNAARLYMRNISFAYVGDPARLDRSLLSQF